MFMLVVQNTKHRNITYQNPKQKYFQAMDFQC